MKRLLLFALAACSSTSIDRTLQPFERPTEVDTKWTPFGDGRSTYQPDREREIDVEHYEIHLSVDPDRPETSGWIDIKFTAAKDLAAFTLDAEDMTIAKVHVDGTAAEYSHAGRQLTIRRTLVNQTKHHVYIIWTGKPARGLRYVPTDAAYPDRKALVRTAGAPDTQHRWFPCVDHPNDRSTSETFIHAPDNYTVLANGTQRKREEQEGATITHHRDDQTHAVSAIWFMVGEFDSYNDGDLVELHVMKGLMPEEEVRRRLGMIRPAMLFFGRITGLPYPFAKYKHVLLPGDERPEWMIVRDLAREWFGRLITARTWADAWLDQGWATYAAWLWTELKHGPGAMQLLGQAGARRLFDEPYLRPLFCAAYGEPDDLIDAHSTERGAWILHMLRGVLGDEVFYKCLRLYVQHRARGLVDSREFQREIEAGCNRDLRWFFEQWVFGMGVPELEVTHRWMGGQLKLTFEQKQKARRVKFGELDSFVPEIYRLPIEIRVDDRIERVVVDLRRKEFVLSGAEPKLVSFGGILARLTWKKSPSELAWQLAKDPNAAGRQWAAAQVSDETALVAARSDKELEVAAEAVRSLARIRAAKALAGLAEDERLRPAVLQELGAFATDPEIAAILKKAVETDARCRSVAAASLGRTGEFDFLRAQYEATGDPGALEGMVIADAERGRPFAREALNQGKPVPLRVRAARLLPIASFLDDPEPAVRIAVIERLEDRAAIEARFPKETDPDVRRAAKLRLRRI